MNSYWEHMVLKRELMTSSKMCYPDLDVAVLHVEDHAFETCQELQRNLTYPALLFNDAPAELKPIWSPVG